QLAWRYWAARLTRLRIDRAPLARRLKDLMRKEKSLDTQYNRALMKDLGLALVPSKAKPGSIQALVDALVDCRSSAWIHRPQPDACYWRVVEKGFDAIPILIEHLDDNRLTRNKHGRFHLRLRHVVGDLLDELAGGKLERNWREKGGPVNKASALKWWLD